VIIPKDYQQNVLVYICSLQKNIQYVHHQRMEGTWDGLLVLNQARQGPSKRLHSPLLWVMSAMSSNLRKSLHQLNKLLLFIGGMLSLYIFTYYNQKIDPSSYQEHIIIKFMNEFVRIGTKLLSSMWWNVLNVAG
jgi:hypothetical protein